MILFLFSCLQGVQTTANPNQLEEACAELCAVQESACGTEQGCDGSCTSIRTQIEASGCDALALDLWQCQQTGEWNCEEGRAVFVDESCSEQEDSFLECMTPQDTGAMSN